MVMELDIHQGPLGSLGTYTRHGRLAQDMSGRPRSPQLIVPPPPSSVPSLPASFRAPTLTKRSRGSSVCPRDPEDLNHTSTAIPNTISGSRSWSQSPESSYDLPQEMETRLKTGMPCCGVEEERAEVVLPEHPLLAQMELDLRRKKKRVRTLDDVDGPGTAALSCKKRRLLLRLVTSRLSRPFSLPATHILIRESGDNMPVLHRIQQLAALGVRRAAGHQGALLVRKAAILNRIRIGVRQAAVSRGHTIMADLARRYNALNHGLLLVTTPASATFPVANAPIVVQGQRTVPPVWRPHTTSFHPPIDHGRHPYYVNHHHPLAHHNYHHNQNHQEQQQFSSNRIADATNYLKPRNAHQGREIPAYSNTNTAQTQASRAHREAREATTSPSQPGHHCPQSRQRATIPPPPTDAVSDEEDNTAFPAASFHDRYADLSDDDMDDVYADFGVLFGSGARSPDRGVAGSPVEEQFYEEYLDELDGIPWLV